MDKSIRVKILLLFLLVLPVSLFAQHKTSIDFAPYSIKLWGRMPSTFTVQVQHGSFMAGYYHVRREFLDELKSPTRTNTVGLFYKPIVPLGDIAELSPIIGVFNHRFPTKNGAWWAFGISLNVKITKHLGIYYQHISNGWLAYLNPGLDNVGLKYTFSKKASDVNSIKK